jgi:hypothetical protein
MSRWGFLALSIKDRDAIREKAVDRNGQHFSE